MPSTCSTPKAACSSWNLGAQRIKGYLPHEIIGQHFSRFYTEEDRKAGEPQRALETVARAGRFEKEGLRVRKDGTRFWAHVVIDAIRDESGSIIAYAKITRDITERKEAEKRLEKAREVLLQSQKMEAIGQLTGGIAHDFNNLLMVVLGSLELVRKRLPRDEKIIETRRQCHSGSAAGSHSHEADACIRATTGTSRRQPIDIPELVRGMTDLLERSLGPGISIETRFPLAPSPSVGTQTSGNGAAQSCRERARCHARGRSDRRWQRVSGQFKLTSQTI